MQWLAGHTPSWINSDHLTLLVLIAMLSAGAFYWAANQNRIALLFVVVSLAVNWLGDSLDGTLARFRNRRRPRYGYYVDHVVDLLGISALIRGLAFSGFMSPLVAFALLASFAIVEAEIFLATHVRQVFRLSCFGLGSTELRIALAIETLYLLYDPWVYIDRRGPFLLFDLGGAAAIGGLLSAFIYSSIRTARILRRAEPIVHHAPMGIIVHDPAAQERKL